MKYHITQAKEDKDHVGTAVVWTFVSPELSRNPKAQRDSVRGILYEHLDLTFPASRTVSELMSVALSRSVCAALFWQSQGRNTASNEWAHAFKRLTWPRLLILTSTFYNGYPKKYFNRDQIWNDLKNICPELSSRLGRYTAAKSTNGKMLCVKKDREP